MATPGLRVQVTKKGMKRVASCAWPRDSGIGRCNRRLSHAIGDPLKVIGVNAFIMRR